MTEIKNGNQGRQGADGASDQVKAVLYIRVASSHPQDASAATRQREACMQVAARQGLHIVREYADLGKPSRYERQTALQKLLDDLGGKRDAGIVLVSDYTRFSRRTAELAAVVDRISACGAAITTAQDSEKGGNQ